MMKVPLTTLKFDLSKYLRLAEKEEVLIMRYGKPAGVLKGFATVDDYRKYEQDKEVATSKRSEKSGKKKVAKSRKS